MEKTIYIIESIYHGKCEDLYDVYPHETLKGAEDHFDKLIKEFIKEHDGKKPNETAIIPYSAYIEYGELFNDNLTLRINEQKLEE